MDPGKMDRLLKIESPPTGQNTYGEVEATGAWTFFCNAWAEKRDVGGREVLADGVRLGEVTAVFRIWYLPGLSAQHRLTDITDGAGGAVYDVVNIKELGRKEGMEVLAKRRDG